MDLHGQLSRWISKMILKDIVELIRVDMPDRTEYAYDVLIESDDNGPHITISVEDHKNARNILISFSSRFNDCRILVMKVPKGSIHELS